MQHGILDWVMTAPFIIFNHHFGVYLLPAAVNLKCCHVVDLFQEQLLLDVFDTPISWVTSPTPFCCPLFIALLLYVVLIDLSVYIDQILRVNMFILVFFF